MESSHVRRRLAAASSFSFPFLAFMQSHRFACTLPSHRCVRAANSSLLALSPHLSTFSSPSTQGTALATSARHKASHLRIANRKKVEMFIGKRFHLPTRLRTAAPDIADEWSYERNPGNLYPEIVGIGYMDAVWWHCKECGEEYQISVEKRVVRGGGCPACDRRHLQASEQQKGDEMESVSRPLANVVLASAAAEPTGSDLAKAKQGFTDARSMGGGEEEMLLEGELDPALRPKRSTVLNLRTKY